MKKEKFFQENVISTIQAPSQDELKLYYNNHKDEFFAPSTLVITNLNSGLGSTNVSPGDLKMLFNVRNCTISDDKSVQKFVENKLIDNGVKKENYNIIVEAHSKPFLTNKKSLVVKKTKEAIEYITNSKTDANTKGGTSDARFFAQYGIDVVEFGVRNNFIHKVNERVCVEDVKLLSKVFDYLIKSF
jgi:succinyl-diaminopimelate desuccinylase